MKNQFAKVAEPTHILESAMLYDSVLGSSVISLVKTKEAQYVNKRIHKDRLVSQELLDDAIRECQIHSQLEHPNIVNFYGYKITDEYIDLRMEYLNKHDYLHRKVSDLNIALSNIPKIKEICISVLNALNYLHSKNIIHADIKPENVLIHKSSTGRIIKICDFGLSLQITGDKPYLEVTNYYGTYPYMAPEIRKSGHICSKSDIYSFGVLLYSMLNGCFMETPSPFPDPVANDLISLCIEQDIVKRIDAAQALQHQWLKIIH